MAAYEIESHSLALYFARKARREEHCTHPEQAWCDCDWCRVVREVGS